MILKRKAYFPVNKLAPRDGSVTVFVKKVGEKKSDGFVVVNNGKVFVIDVGKKNEDQLIRFLIALREKWLGERVPSGGKPAKLELSLIVSHAHSDHIAALPLLLDDGRFCVTKIYAPARAHLGSPVEGAIPSLVEHEDKLEAFCQNLAARGHTAKGITRSAYGKPFTLKMGSKDATLKIYPSHIDWSEDRPSDGEGIRYIIANNPEAYKDNPQIGYTNGVLNGNSLWVKVTKGERSVLITGDQRASDEMLNAMIRYYGEGEFACDVLKLTHHGEKNYPPYLLEVAKPSVTIFTTSYEKAKRETVELCEKMGLINYYACDGDLLIRTDGKEIRADGIEPR